ncbi:18 kDa cyclophilin, putative [Eimeria necatrix]|uniref:Peptidyl-prolyl cis-trans isomerase n=1 Tax=Eimeria necatrix TaxID=51315 RepID=U6MJ15_9EIME|nr:18 kDa cyclophilin, putative [Eimeria necatrix]CDJ63043.1 18 kDa cyclophilin, putative [Eimeria necatrix]
MKRTAPVALVALLALTASLNASADPVKEAFLEIAINGEPIGFLNFNLRPDVVPKTVQNFVGLLPRYVGTFFHRIIPDFMVQGGDVQRNSRPDADTQPVDSFEDENFELKHVGPGILSMANAGPNTNSSQFFVTTVATPWLDNRHVVFGTITEDSMEVLKRIEATGSSSGRPSASVTVKSSGVGHRPNAS